MSWRPSLRIAAREARRAKARSVLIVAMIALPVVALSFADVMWRTSEVDAAEHLARALGASDASVVMSAPEGATILQAADPTNGRYTINGDSQAQPKDLRELQLLPDQRLLVENRTDVAVVTRGGKAVLGWAEVDAADPAFAGRWVLESGRYPESSAEVMLTPVMRDRTGLTVGERLELVEPARTYTVVGVVSQAGERGMNSAVALPGALLDAPGGIPLDRSQSRSATGFVMGGSVSWQQVQALNMQGAVVTSRAVLTDPPATTAFDEQLGDVFDVNVADYVVPVLILAMVVALSGLIVCLLAGTAFAVGARRQARSLALVAAAGGDRRDMRRVVLGGGVVLGFAAGVVGVVGGVLLAAVVDQLIWHFGWLLDVSLASFDVRPLDLAAITLLGVVTGVLAAAVPARQAGRIDVVAALRGRSGAPRRLRRTPVIGIVMIIAGVALSVVGSGWVAAAQNGGSTRERSLVVATLVGGAALVLLGLVVCAGSVVSLATRLAPRLPLAGRLALRDAERHRTRSAPAVAAILAAVSGSVALMLYVAALDQSDREQYTPGSPPGTATVNLVVYGTDPDTGDQTTHYVDPDAAISALGSTLPIARAVPIVQPVCGVGCQQSVDITIPPEHLCLPPGDGATAEEFEAIAEANPDCIDSPAVDFWAVRADAADAIGGRELLTLRGGSPSEDALRMLQEGGVVVADSRLVGTDGRVTVEAITNGKDTKVRVPAAVLPADQMTFNVVLSPALAQSMGIETATTRLLLVLDGAVSADDEDAANAALGSLFGTDEFQPMWLGALHVERGYESTYGLGLLALAAAAGVITLGATGISTGLALSDARADHATLAAVGASPRLRRRLAAAQSLVMGLLGVLLGVAAGAVPALSIVGAAASLHVVWPWPQLAMLVVGIPLLAGAFAYVFTRSRVPLQRRVVA